MRVRALTLFMLLLSVVCFLALPSFDTKQAPVAEAPRPFVSASDASVSTAPVTVAHQTTPDEFITDAPATPPGPNIIGEWAGPPPVVLWDVARAQARENAPPATHIPLRLNKVRSGTMLVETYRPTEEDGGVFVGTLDGVPGSTVVLSYVGKAQAGVVLLPAEHRAFNFRAGDDGILRVTELDTRNAPDCGQPATPLIPAQASRPSS